MALVWLNLISFSLGLGASKDVKLVGCWEEDVIGLVEQKHGKKKVSVSFECETLKAEDHIRQFMPKLPGLDAVINIGPMKIKGLDFAAVEDEHTN